MKVVLAQFMALMNNLYDCLDIELVVERNS